MLEYFPYLNLSPNPKCLPINKSIGQNKLTAQISACWSPKWTLCYATGKGRRKNAAILAADVVVHWQRETTLSPTVILHGDVCLFHNDRDRQGLPRRDLANNSSIGSALRRCLKNEAGSLVIICAENVGDIGAERSVKLQCVSRLACATRLSCGFVLLAHYEIKNLCVLS